MPCIFGCYGRYLDEEGVEQYNSNRDPSYFVRFSIIFFRADCIQPVVWSMDINDKKEHWSDRHWKLITVVAILSLVGSFALLVIFGPSLR